MKCDKIIVLTYFRLDSCLVLRKILKAYRENNGLQLFLIHKNHIELKWVIFHEMEKWSSAGKLNVDFSFFFFFLNSIKRRECRFFLITLIFLLHVVARYDCLGQQCSMLGSILRFLWWAFQKIQMTSPRPNWIRISGSRTWMLTHLQMSPVIPLCS